MIINMIFCSPDQPVATDHELGPTLLSYTRQVALGLMYLSFKKFVHRDIAARNVLVNDEGICKVHKVAWKSMESTSLYHRSKCSHNTFTAWTTIKILHLTMTLYSYVHTHTLWKIVTHACVVISWLFCYLDCWLWLISRFIGWKLLCFSWRQSSCEMDSPWSHKLSKILHGEWCVELWLPTLWDVVPGSETFPRCFQ